MNWSHRAESAALEANGFQHDECTLEALAHRCCSSEAPAPRAACNRRSSKVAKGTPVLIASSEYAAS
jgi:hypothetical protein